MTEKQKQLLQALLTDAIGSAPSEQTALAHLFYERLFTVAPTVRSLFHNQRSLQEEKLTNMLLLLLESLDRLDKLVPVLWQSGRKHRLYGAEAAHYPVVGEVLLWALEQKLGPERLTPDVRAAWNEFYEWISLIMIQASQEP